MNSAQLLSPGEYVRKEILIPRGLSVSATAKLLGVGRPALSNFLNGKASLSTEMASRIERVFNLPAKYLLELQVHIDAQEATETNVSATVKRYVPRFLDITSSEIDVWASRIVARFRLAVFLRTLVNSTGSGLTHVDFPGNDDSERPGPDGLVIAREETQWIPKGNSYWEFGCNEDPNVKAKKDYEKSVRLIEIEERQNSTFIFVTPRRWQGKVKWINDHKNGPHWRNVRAYDASDLEQWVAQSIPGQTWFADETKRPESKTRSLDKCWIEWAKHSTPSLVEDFFNDSVNIFKKKIVEILTQDPREPIIVKADSIEEALGFLSCLFSENTDLFRFRDKVVVFDKPGILPVMADGASDFIAVITPGEVAREVGPYLQSIHTIIVYPRNAIHDEPHILLEPVSTVTFRQALEKMAFDNDKVNRLEIESGRSLTVLRRRLSNVPEIRRPEWASNDEMASSMVPYLFAGAWSSSNARDRELLSILANRKQYNELEKTFQRITQINDTPLWSEGEYRGLISKIDVLFAISTSLTKDEISNFFTVAEIVLSEDDPAIDYPPGHLFALGIYSKRREISKALRNGIAETLVLLAVHGNNLFQRRLGIDVEQFVAKTVRKLLGDPLTSRTLEMHGLDLASYAEASPDQFLKMIEHDLRSNASACTALLRPVDSGIFSSCPRIGLLCALESLAWSPETIYRTALILAKLSETKIEDNWANTPIASLSAIFRAWMPQTAANVDQRIEVLRNIVKAYPEIGWSLCVEQFSNKPSYGTYSYKPRWRNDGQGHGDPVSHEEAYNFISTVADICLNWPKHNLSTVDDLICRIHILDRDRQISVWRIVEDWGKSASDRDKAVIRERIRVTLMSAKGIARIKKKNATQLVEAANSAYALLEPTDVISRHEWLFKQNWVDESYDEIIDGETNLQARDKRIKKKRINALRIIWGERRVAGIMALAESGKTAFIIGWLMTSDILKTKDIAEFIVSILRSLNNSNRATCDNLIGGALIALHDDKSLTAIIQKIEKVTTQEEYAKVLEFAPFRSTTWILVSKLPDSLQKQYWTMVRLRWERQTKDDLNEIVAKLITFKRPAAAFDFVAGSLENLHPTTLFKLLDALVTIDDTSEELNRISIWEIEKAFEYLEASGEFTLEELAILEFGYLDVLADGGGYAGHRGIPNLEKYIENNPKIFALAVAWFYKRGDGKTDTADLQVDDPIQFARRSLRGYKLIESLHRVPGRNRNGDIDPELLLNWVKAVRSACAELGRDDGGDSAIGKMLSHAPAGIDGIRPCEAVREVLEHVQSEKIAEAVVTGLYNSRGVHSKIEGGDQERSIAARYRKWKTAVEFTQPFVAATIYQRLEDIYEHDAKEEDMQASIGKRLR
ncbi:hypothetical protein GCM10007423_08830 [Dyadobacter endophyticus]|uniref:HTH cro/C1-type domain-containing protein n=1 Tax=Dyadobacter endophyticus TaxID=1749036 RepID=A0ABQ1YGZ7_9BACT|nr:HigA family addiction module antitoxin [Dyadobacter endophyticus]GGH24962.1 hypothetical protein GCM10007423_08830 [Dyadobacter endophyticus]